MQTIHPRNVNFSEYEHSFSYDLLKDFEEGRLDGFDIETMRGLIYGYTFTEDYAKGIIPETLSMEYWSQKDPPRRSHKPPKKLREIIPISFFERLGHRALIYNAIKSTGNGTVDNPYCVICVEHEYEFLKMVYPLKVVKQYLLPGNIDCFELEGGDHPQKLYFDMSHWFEKVKLF